MKLVIIESPYAGNVEYNIRYAKRCVRDSLNRGEAPIASHLLYTQSGILDDNVSIERQQGIDAGLAWRKVVELSAVYTDLGISSGMKYGVKVAEEVGVEIEYRSIGVDKQPLTPERVDQIINESMKNKGDLKRYLDGM